MDVLGKARRLESTIAAKLDEAAKGFVQSRMREPLEIVLAILEAVEQRIEPTGRGARVFPFNRIELSVVAPSREARGRLEAVFAADTSLRTRILNRVQSAGCSPAEAVVEIQYFDHAEPNWSAPEFDLQFARVAEPEIDGREIEPQPGQIDIRVLCGVMERWAYSFTARASTSAGARRSEIIAIGSFARTTSCSPREGATSTRPSHESMPTSHTSRSPVNFDCTMTVANTEPRWCAGQNHFGPPRYPRRSTSIGR